jgi:dienelactone hydrolase
LPPLQSTPPVLPLPVPGFEDAVVSVPTGARSPRPVVIATHGIWDFPEALCDTWRWIVDDRAWVLCPRGDRMPDKSFRYRSGPALADEIDAGVGALARRYPGYVDDGPLLYTGFSLGAILGAWLVAHDPARYPRAVLIEGGDDKFDAAKARAYARGGGQRVLFACGLAFRVARARQAAHLLEVAGVEVRVVLGKAPDAGQYAHWYGGPVGEEVRAQLPWLLDGDARYGAAHVP